MKLQAREVEAMLARGAPPAPVVLFYGPDRGLVGERARRLIGALLGRDDDPFRLVTLEGDDLARDPGRLAEEALAPTFFGGGRVVRVRDAGDRTAAALEPLLGRDGLPAHVVLEAGELPPSSRLRRLVEGAKTAVACPCYREEGRDLVSAVERLLAEHGLRADPEALSWLTAHLGADHGITRREIEKLALYVGDREDRTVHLADVEAVVADAAAAGTDRLIQALLAGDVAAVEDGAERLLAAGEAPVTLLRAATRELLRLYALSLEVAAGGAAQQVVARAKPPVFFRLRPLVERLLARIRPDDVADLLALLQRAEILCKSTGVPERTVCRRALFEVARRLQPAADRTSA